MTHELHPLCTLFPRVEGADFDALVADIRANGLRQPIVLHDGMILDGGNRYRACLQAGVEPKFIDFDGDNIVSFVMSANLHRRHLSAGQQAAIVSSAQNWAKAQTVGRPKSGNVAGLATAEQTKSGNVALLQTIEDRAAQSGASERTQRMADKVAKADPELAKRVAHGEVSLPKAVEQVTGRQRAKPKQEVVRSDESVELRAMLAEQASQFEETLAENIALQKVVDADDKLAEAMTQIKQLTAENQKLRERINGLTNEAAEAKKLAKFWRAKAERAEKAAA